MPLMSASQPQVETETHPNSDEEESLRATYAGAKRRIAALEQQLQALQDVGKRQKS
jgi:hypothetical protein